VSRCSTTISGPGLLGLGSLSWTGHLVHGCPHAPTTPSWNGIASNAWGPSVAFNGSHCSQVADIPCPMESSIRTDWRTLPRRRLSSWGPGAVVTPYRHQEFTGCGNPGSLPTAISSTYQQGSSWIKYPPFGLARRPLSMTRTSPHHHLAIRGCPRSFIAAPMVPPTNAAGNCRHTAWKEILGEPEGVYPCCSPVLPAESPGARHAHGSVEFLDDPPPAAQVAVERPWPIAGSADHYYLGRHSHVYEASLSLHRHHVP